MSIKNIFRRKTAAWSSLLNVLGMAMAFAALYIIFVQVDYDLGYNKGIKDSERIYAISVPDWYEEGHYMTWLNRPMCEKMISDISCVEAGGMSYCASQGAREDYYLSAESETSVSLFRSSFSAGALDVFGMQAVSGSFDKMPTLSGGMALSEKKAKELSLSVGDVLYLKMVNGGKMAVHIAAIFKEFPKNSDMYGFDCFNLIGNESINNWSEWSYPYFVKLRSTADKEEFEKQALDLMLKLSAEDSDEPVSEDDIAEVERRLKVRLFPLEQLYFEKSVGTAGRSGSRISTYTLLAIAILVIIIAFINFVNFFFALVPVRLKSFNTRKILGASRMRLAMSVVGESVVMVVTAIAIAALLVHLFAGSEWGSLMRCSIAFSQNIGVMLCVVVTMILLGVASSLYPALYITSFSPAFALRGSLGSTAKGKLFRTGLIGFQFLVSICLIICVSFITMQRSYMLHHDLGFNRSRLLEVRTSYKIAGPERETATDKLKSEPGIKDVTWANGRIIEPGRMGWGRQFKEEQINFQCYPVSYNFLDFMGIELVEGRDFTKSDELSEKGVFIFNEAARDKFGLTLEDKMEGHNGLTDIAGICKNFNYRPLSGDVAPFALYIFGKNSWKVNNTLYIRTESNVDYSLLMGRIKGILHELDPMVSEDEINVRFFDQSLESEYQAEKRTSHIILLFTILAIVISLMGVFGLVMFEAEYRRKEIGIRRVNGATIPDILKMFNVKYIKTVLVCFVIAAPLAWYIVDSYLKGFAYRMPMHWWIFALALSAVLIVTVCVVTLRSLSAATSAPVESIHTE